MPWIGELLEIFVAETVEALRKIADVPCNIGRVENKVNPLGLVKSDYFPKLGINGRKAVYQKNIT